jgi:hypothetical protein
VCWKFTPLSTFFWYTYSTPPSNTPPKSKHSYSLNRRHSNPNLTPSFSCLLPSSSPTLPHPRDRRSATGVACRHGQLTRVTPHCHPWCVIASPSLWAPPTSARRARGLSWSIATSGELFPKKMVDQCFLK